MKNITKRFGKVVANDHVSLDIKRGEILSLLGENGSGKTTLMNMLAGIYFPDEGEILVNGQSVTIASPKDAFDCGIARKLKAELWGGIILVIIGLKILIEHLFLQ